MSRIKVAVLFLERKIRPEQVAPVRKAFGESAFIRTFYLDPFPCPAPEQLEVGVHFTRNFDAAVLALDVEHCPYLAAVLEAQQIRTLFDREPYQAWVMKDGRLERLTGWMLEDLRAVKR